MNTIFFTLSIIILNCVVLASESESGGFLKRQFPWMYRKPGFYASVMEGRQGFFEEPLLETPHEALKKKEQEFQEKKNALEAQAWPYIEQDIKKKIETEIRPRIEAEKKAALPSLWSRIKYTLGLERGVRKAINQRVAQEAEVLRQQKRDEIAMQLESMENAAIIERDRNRALQVEKAGAITRDVIEKYPLDMDFNVLGTDLRELEKRKVLKAKAQQEANAAALEKRAAELSDQIYAQKKAKVAFSSFISQQLLDNFYRESEQEARMQAFKEFENMQLKKEDERKKKEEAFFAQRSAERRKLFEQASEGLQKFSMEPSPEFAGEADYPTIRETYAQQKQKYAQKQQRQERQKQAQKSWEDAVEKKASKLYQESIKGRGWWSSPTRQEELLLQTNAFEKARKSTPLPELLKSKKKPMSKQPQQPTPFPLFLEE